MLESSSVQLKCYPCIIQQFTTFLFKKTCFKHTLKFYFLFAFTIVSLIEQSFTVITFFFAIICEVKFFFCLILFVVIINITRLSSNLSPNHSNFRSRIICGPFLGSFVVLYRPLKTITNRATYTFLQLARVQSPESRVQCWFQTMPPFPVLIHCKTITVKFRK